MKKSYRKLVRQTTHRDPLQGVVDAAVSAAILSLRRHNPREVICSRCENNDENCFEVIKIDEHSSIVTETKCKRCIKCKRCNELIYVCHSQCYCKRCPVASHLENSYKEQIRSAGVQQHSRSIPTCIVLEATITVLLSEDRPNSRIGCLCDASTSEPRDMTVVAVDRLGFITGVQCPNCHNDLAFSPLEESYVVQMLYHGQRDQAAVIEQALNRDYVQHIRELCDLLRRHSFYQNAICPECDNNHQESCRVIGIHRETGKVNEVDFVAPDYNQSLIITCRSGCYYAKCPSAASDRAPVQWEAPSGFERSYKEKVKAQLIAVGRTNKPRSRKAILSCTVLAGTAAILRRHNIDNTLCQNCKNNDHEFLEVKEVDDLGFITSVECVDCRQRQSLPRARHQSTACHRSRFYYEEIDETVPLERGDHISWHRIAGFWHHAIVTRADDETVTFAEYIPRDNACRLALKETTKRRDGMSPSCTTGIPYRITYEDCYTNEYAALRAERSIGEKQYHPLNRNCEHASYWCKTGLRKSDQVKTFSRSTWKTIFAYVLRIVNMVLLMVFQVIHEQREGNQIDHKTFRLFERIIIFVYMSIVFLLFLGWSLYTEFKKLKPDIDSCCCKRPACVVCGLCVRITTRELWAVAGPFLVIWFEDDILPEAGDWKRLVVISVVFLVVSFGSYVVGALLGTSFEHVSRRCSIHLRKCCSDDDSENRRENPEDQSTHEIRRACDDNDTSNLPENMQN